MTYTPVPKVEVAFGFGPYSEPGALDWVDITEWVFEVGIERGRSSEFDQFPASTATVMLVNDDRRFDPLNTAGPYYGNLLANVPIRITATVSAVEYPVWRGYVDGWPAEYREGGFRSEVELDATDAFKLLTERPFPDTWLSFLEDFGPPDGWYPSDSAGPDGLVNAGGTGTGDQLGQPGGFSTTVKTTDPLSPVSHRAIELPGLTGPNASFYWAVQMPIISNTRDNPVATTAWSVSFLMRSTGRGFQGLVDVFLPNRDFPLIIAQADIAGGLNQPMFVIDTGPANLSATGAEDIGDGLVHHIVVVRNAIQGILFVDGNYSANEIDGAASGVLNGEGGRVILGRSPTGPTPGNGVVIDELMFWKRALSSLEVRQLYSELTTGFADIQSSGVAINLILDEIDWPASLRDIDTGETLVRLPARPLEANTLELLQNVAQCEGGRLFIDASGRITFHDRSRFTREAVETTVQYEFSDINRDLPTPPNAGIRDGTLSITVDDRFTFDAAEITREDGITQTSRTTTTPARTHSANGLFLNSDRQALSLAQWTTFRYSTAQPRSETWDVDGEVLPADWPALLGLEVGHRIRHTLTPGGVGSSLQLDQHVAFIGHTITAEEWIITLNGSPTDPNEAAYFLWDAVETVDTDNGWGDTDGDPPGGYWG